MDWKKLLMMGALGQGGAQWGPPQTLALQTGQDTMLIDVAPDTNYGALNSIGVGELSTGGQLDRALIKFDLSTIPAGSLIVSATLSLYAITDVSANARAFRVYRSKRAWVDTQATWNSYSTGNAWQTAGGFGANDCEQTDIGNRNFTDAETTSEFKVFALSAAAIRQFVNGEMVNNGFLIKADTELNDAYTFASFNHATAANRPKLEVVYRPPL